jgi:hypothetical protein
VKAIRATGTIAEQEADRLKRDGRIPKSIGREFIPLKYLFLLTEQQLADTTSRVRRLLHFNWKSVD